MDSTTAAATKSRGRWFQYKLRSLFIVMLVLGAAMTGFVAKRNQARRQRLAAEAIANHGGLIIYDYQLIPTAGAPKYDSKAIPVGPGWMRSFIGEDILAHVMRAKIVTDSDVDSLKELPDLDWLELVSPLADPGHPEWLAELNPRKRGGFDFSPISDSQLDCLKSHAGLRALQIEAVQINDGGLQKIEGLRELEFLELSGPTFSDSGLVHVSGLSSLKTLYLHGRGFTDAGLVRLNRLAHLRELQIDDTGVSDAGMEQLAVLPELEVLSLTGDAISDKGLMTLAKSRSLRHIFIDLTAVSAAGVSRFHRIRPRCEVSTGTTVIDPQVP
jgi:hypothetical protein